MKWIFPSAACALMLGACANAPQSAQLKVAAQAPPQWVAPLPHQGTITDLTRWWQQFDDPLLAELIDAAQTASPTLASAQSRVEQARATRVASGAALLPSISANAGISRGRSDFISPLGTTATATAQASWELDVFGGSRAARDASQFRLEGAQANWHVARVSVAAEVATSYVGLRACEAQVVQARTDATSRNETARLTGLTAQAGFESPANESLARASAAQARAQLASQTSQCELSIKALVALTAIDEPTLRAKLSAATARVPLPPPIALASVPAQTLDQRPDVYAAARAVEAASSDVTNARAQRWPRVVLTGSVGGARFEGSGFIESGALWSIGPLSVTLPIFDGGTRAANVEAARARYDEATALYRAALRTAVREVEQALVQLQYTAVRTTDARIAAEGFDASYRATEARYRGGLASLFELEEARRNAVLAQIALIDLQRERAAAWVALYRAAGGSWTYGATAVPSTPISLNASQRSAE